MGAQKQQRKILRIGLIQGGRITEERLIPRGQNVTIGDGQKNTFVLHSAGLPKRFPIFTYRGGRYYLGFTSDMDGKLSMDGGVVMGFDAVKENATRLRDGSYQFSLTDQVRGKVTIAGTTILFQFVTPPPVPARGAQRDFAGTWLRQVDSTYLGIFAASFLIHTTVMLYALSLPAPKELTLEEVPDRFARIITPTRPEALPDTDVGESDKEKEEEEDKEPEKKDPNEKKNDKNADKASESKPLDEKARREKRKNELKKVGILKVLGSKFAKSKRGFAGDDILSTADSFSLGDLMDSRAKGMASASTAGELGLRGVTNSDLIGSGDVNGVATDTKVDTGKRVAKRIPKVDIDGPADLDGVIDKNTLQVILKKNLPGVKSCYDKALKLNPNLRGKIYIDFTVEENGRISFVDVRSTKVADQDMVNCIKARVRRWKFPEAEESSDVTLAVVLTAS